MTIDLQKIKTIHFTGIKGVGMTSLALCARDLRKKITGSDVAEIFVTDKTLANNKIKWETGFSAKNITNPDLLIFTGAHDGEDNIEVITAKEKEIPALSQAEALGLFMENKIGISVCGVGGKTTTSAMIATILDKVGLKPSFAIGVGDIASLGVPGRFDEKGRYFIAEADEYFASPKDKKPRFSYQQPKVIVLTNIEFDHPDVYKNLDHTIKVFKQFVEKLPKDGLLVTCIDNANIRRLLQLIKVPTQTYGFDPKADWQLVDWQQQKEKITFSLKNKNRKIENLELKVPGRFNSLNAVAAFVVAQFIGITEEKIKKGLKSFMGTKRRFELIAKFKQIQLYDDYAHHPLEIRVTLRAAESWFNNERIIAIFQPHTYSRTKALLKEFSQAFSAADLVIITDIYASAREKDDLGVSGRLLAQQTSKYHPKVIFKPTKQAVIKFLKKEVKRGDIIITLGAGDIFLWHKELIKNLRNLN